VILTNAGFLKTFSFKAEQINRMAVRELLSSHLQAAEAEKYLKQTVKKEAHFDVAEKGGAKRKFRLSIKPVPAGNRDGSNLILMFEEQSDHEKKAG